MAGYTWTSSTTYCNTETHKTQDTCTDCDTPGQCAGCHGTIPAGQPHRICRQNGESVHAGCEKAAAGRWGPGYW